MKILYIIIFTIFFLILYYKSRSISYRLIVWLHIISFVVQFLICIEVTQYDITTFANIIFICINLFLIIAPWAKLKPTIDVPQDYRYIRFLRKFLRPVLLFNLLLCIGLGVIIYSFFPSAKEFKQDGTDELYATIPYFGNLFRYAYTTQLFGYIAMPVFFYSLAQGDKKDTFLWLLATLSSLAAGVAFFSRANMIIFMLLFIFFYNVQGNQMGYSLKKKFSKLLRYSFIAVAIGFVTMSYNRFSRMTYLSERIPKESVVQDITSYYMLFYAGQSFPYGINSLNNYTSEKCQNGDSFFYNVYQILAFFNIIEWNSTDAIENREKALGDMQDKFLGYTAESVYDLGYLGTLLLSIIFYSLSRKNIYSSTSIRKYINIAILIQMPLNSIFYNCIRGVIVSLIFIFILNILYKLRHNKIGFVSPTRRHEAKSCTAVENVI